MRVAHHDSKRLRAFRQHISKAMPKVPNNRAVRDEFEGKPLDLQLVHYLHWASRFIWPRPRTVLVDASVETDPRWSRLEAQIRAVLAKAERGDDLTPHLSLEVHTRAYSPASGGTGPDVDIWCDKDFVLIASGYHHLHLGEIGPKGFAERTDEVLFVRVAREQFEATGIFDHSVFESASDTSGVLTGERERMWSIFEERASAGLAPGTAYIASPITTSGHNLGLSLLAQDYARIVYEFDPQLDSDSGFVESLYESSGLRPPREPRFEWRLRFLDLGLFEKGGKFLRVLRRGPQ
jgi:hypothetical protein